MPHGHSIEGCLWSGFSNVRKMCRFCLTGTQVHRYFLCQARNSVAGGFPRRDSGPAIEGTRYSCIRDAVVTRAFFVLGNPPANERCSSPTALCQSFLPYICRLRRADCDANPPPIQASRKLRWSTASLCTSAHMRGAVPVCGFVAPEPGWSRRRTNSIKNADASWPARSFFWGRLGRGLPGNCPGSGNAQDRGRTCTPCGTRS